MAEHRDPRGRRGNPMQGDGQHIDIERQPSALTVRGRIVDLTSNSAFYDADDEVDRGNPYVRT